VPSLSAGLRALVGVGLLALAGGAAAGSAVAPLVIDDVTVIDAEGGVRPGRSLLLEDGRIAALWPADDSAKAPAIGAGVTRLDGRDQFLIPGLWDAHVHVTFLPEVDYRVFFDLALRHGITALRDTGGRLDDLAPARAAAGTPDTPDLFVAGPLIDGEPPVYDGSGRFLPAIGIGHGDGDAVTARVDALAAAGVDFLKGYEMLSREQLAALVAAADRHGLKVAAHVPLAMSAGEAALTGIDDMQHLRNLELACARDHSALLKERRALLEDAAEIAGSDLRQRIHERQRPVALAQQDDATCRFVVAALASAGVHQTPTLTMVTFRSLRLYADPAWRQGFDLLPAAAAAGWHRDAAALSEQPLRAGAAPLAAWARKMVARLHEAGVPMLAGTDSPLGFLTPGLSLHKELELLVDAGLPPLDALRAATVAPAAFLGVDDEVGTIAAGKRANLVLLREDPLADIRHTRSIMAVVKDDRLHRF